MLVCPSCRSEYRAGFDRCKTCDVALVDPASLEEEQAAFGAPREQLEGKDKVILPQGNLAAAREMESALLGGGFVCYVHAEEADMDVALGSAAAIKYGVCVARDDVEAVGTFLKERFAGMIAEEGQGTFNTEAVDLEAEVVTCPACGHSGALVDGECPECGLMLGLPG